mmetsp:Transcript_22526/g.55882  ORF Transcript_22526/g.55882 Transcript_22526/m.55882 type:complete len:122 (+) Transcript_22526:501-866(+)
MDITSSPTAEDTLRARYSAYAYDMPLYIMRTTHFDNEDYTYDRRKWRRDINTFCKTYRVRGGMEILEQRITGKAATFFLFRANLYENNQPMSFTERAKFLKEQGKWYYASGKLISVDEEID